MATSTKEIATEVPFFVRVYKDGTYEKLGGTDIVPAGVDPTTGVQSKDVVISAKTPPSVRLYIPKTPAKKLPLLIFFHGGGFVIESAFSPTYHNFLNLVTSESNVVGVSVDYGTTPEYPIPAAFQDSWEALKWVSQHVGGNGPDPWLNEYADFQNVFFGGDNAGGNITHRMAIQVGSENPGIGINPKGLILLNPYFWGTDPLGLEPGNIMIPLWNSLWVVSCPGTSGSDDPLINPDFEPKVSYIKCPRILVFVSGDDTLRFRQWYYKEILEKNGWKGEIEVIEQEGVNHLYFLSDTTSDKAVTLRKKICTFINNVTAEN